MESRDERALEHLRELGFRPAVPFQEGGPSDYILSALGQVGLTGRTDDFGNVITRYTNGPTEGVPPIALVAHMDHPGFEVVEVEDERVVARALGGVPAASLRKPTRVLVVMSDGRRLPAETAPLDPDGERTVELEMDTSDEVEPGAAVVFDLPDFELKDEVIRMRALDDLAGCAAAISALERLVADVEQADVFGVFTRAEEGGLFGARLMAEAGTLPSDTLVVSIESSPVIPGVVQGDGPAIRTGDALSTFDMDAERALQVAARSLTNQNPDFRFQRRLMSGGVCEATAFAAFGYRVTGLAFPLGNYHNATTTIPDADGGVGAEFIQLSDFLGGVDLLEEAVKSVSKRDEAPVKDRLGAVPEDVRSRLASGG